MTPTLTAASAAKLLEASPTKSATSLHGEVRDSDGYTLAYVKTTRHNYETESTHPVCLTYAEQVAVAALFASAPSLAQSVIRLEGERDEAREIASNCLSAVRIDSTTQAIAFAGDIPTYIRTHFDVLIAERDTARQELADYRAKAATVAKDVKQFSGSAKEDFAAIATHVRDAGVERDRLRALLTEARPIIWQIGKDDSDLIARIDAALGAK